jgi:predicted nucleotidyltransferase
VTDFAGLLRAVTAAGVDCILIGGVAATVHGSARLTRDVDLLYRRSDDNLVRLVEAVSPLSPYLRGAPPGLPFVWDVDTIRRGLNFTLTTSIGDLDLLGEVAGGGTYEHVLPQSILVELYGMNIRCVSLLVLIQLKRAAGRPRDLEVIAELEALRSEGGTL